MELLSIMEKDNAMIRIIFVDTANGIEVSKVPMPEQQDVIDFAVKYNISIR